MRPHSNKATTLLELIIAVILLGILVVGLSSIETFSRRHLRTTDQRTRLQNDLSYLLEHMARNINHAIGLSSETVVLDPSPCSGGDCRITVFIDNLSATDPDLLGMRDSADYNISYSFNSSSHTVYYYKNYVDEFSSKEVVASNIETFMPSYSDTNNYIEVNASACWDPSLGTCGEEIRNPQVDMNNRIEMPAVSIN
ncbi:MAG: type II secretion system protein [Candidatus Omnitrophica bacterium]|nr:type II secretion system protein [Candidatus Omnitrophota bacterium]